jgi:hypothetical protein
MPGNNIAEIVLRVTTEGTQNAQVMANQLNQVDQAARQLTTSTLSATTAQRACTTEVGRTHSQLARLLQDWGNLEQQVDHFSATTLRNFSTTSAQALTEWIEGSGKAREAFRGFVTQVIEGLIQMVIQQGIAHAIGLAQTREAGATQAATNAQITASAAPAAATQAAATFGANAAGVLAVVAVIAAAIGILAATRHAAGGVIHGPGSETSDSIPAWLSHNEYVHTATAHRYYGTAAMDAINTRSVPREAIHAAMSQRNFATGGVVALPAFASGGFVGGTGVSPVDISVGGPFVMVGIGDNEISRIMATSEAQKRLFDNSAKNAVRTSRLVTRNGGHRAES